MYEKGTLSSAVVLMNLLFNSLSVRMGSMARQEISRSRREEGILASRHKLPQSCCGYYPIYRTVVPYLE